MPGEAWLAMGKRTVTTSTRVVIEKGSTDWIVECQHCRGSGQKYPGYSNTHSKRKHRCNTCNAAGFNEI